MDRKVRTPTQPVNLSGVRLRVGDGVAFVSDLEKRASTLACPRCKAPMKDVVRIAPVQNDPGLIAYECASCGYVTSVLMGPQSGDQLKGGQST
jgi:rubredoxin